MATIVVCEDDASTRSLICALLSKEGHQVEAFDNGLKGFARLQEGDVELLISDVQMPGKDGFALVAQVREDKQLLDLPCILLTALQERAHMRVGMTSGADDYVTKPFQPRELLDAVDSQLKRALQVHMLHVNETQRTVSAALGERTNELMEVFEKRLQRELQSRWARSDARSSQLQGTLLSCAIQEQEQWLALLTSTQMADMARHFFNKVADSAALFKADYFQFIGEGLLIGFDQTQDLASLNHMGRAMKLVEAMASIRSSMRDYVREHLAAQAGQQALPSFACNMAMHVGELGLGKLEGVAGGIEQLVPVGQDVALMARLLKAAQVLRWPVLLSQTAMDAWSEHLQAQSQTPPQLEHVDIKLQEHKQRIYRASL
jgi:DNA-binding response OmpR family regulator